MYALTPYVSGQSLGVGTFDNEAQAREAQAALTQAVTEDGLTIEWVDHGNVDEAQAFDLFIADLLG